MARGKIRKIPGALRRARRRIADWARRNPPSPGFMGATMGAIAGYHYGGQNLRAAAVGAAIGLAASTKKGRMLAAAAAKKSWAALRDATRAWYRRYRERRARRE